MTHQGNVGLGSVVEQFLQNQPVIMINVGQLSMHAQHSIFMFHNPQLTPLIHITLGQLREPSGMVKMQM